MFFKRKSKNEKLLDDVEAILNKIFTDEQYKENNELINEGYKKIISLCNEIINVEPDNINAMIEKINALIFFKSYEEALVIALSVLKIEENIQIIDKLAVIYESIGEDDKFHEMINKLAVFNISEDDENYIIKKTAIDYLNKFPEFKLS